MRVSKETSKTNSYSHAAAKVDTLYDTFETTPKEIFFNLGKLQKSKFRTHNNIPLWSIFHYQYYVCFIYNICMYMVHVVHNYTNLY